MPPVTQSKAATPKATATAATAPPIPPPAPPVATADASRPILTPVTIEAPMTRLPGDPYKQRRIDLDLSAVEAQALRDLFDGMTINGVFAERKASPSDVIRYLLRRAGEAFAVESAGK